MLSPLNPLAVAPARAVPRAEAALAPSGETIDVATTEGTAVSVPVLLGGALTVSGAPLPVGTRIEATWSSALYEAETAPRLTREIESHACSFVSEPTDDGTTASVTTTIDTELLEGEYLLTLGSVRPLVYPDDIIAPPPATSFTLVLPQGDISAIQEPADSDVDPASQWGVIIGTSWTPVRWGEGYHLWSPVSLTITAVGPAPLPAGARLDVQVDASAFTSLTVGPEGSATAGAVAGKVLRATRTLTEPIAAHTEVTLPVSAAATDLSGELGSYEPPLLAVTCPGSATVQRLTGLETSTREDNATDAASRERYGMS